MGTANVKKVLIPGLLFCLTLQTLPGCLPEDMPAITPDGKHVVLVARDQVEETVALWVCDVGQRTAVPHFVPDEWNILSARWFGDQLWVTCFRAGGVKKDEAGNDIIDEKTGEPVYDTEITCRRYDIGSDSFVEGSPTFDENNVILNVPFVAGREGKPVLFVSTVPDKPKVKGKFYFSVYTLPDLKKSEIIEINRIMPAGKAWSLSFVERDLKGVKGLPTRFGEINVMDDKGQLSCTITAEKIAPACPGEEAKFPNYARVSNDASVIALVFDNGSIFHESSRKYAFGIFDTKTGKLLWFGQSDSLNGVPLITRDAAWTFEGKNCDGDTEDDGPAPASKPDKPYEKDKKDAPPAELTLVKHYPGSKPDEAGKKQDIFTYKLAAGCKIISFAPDPKGENFYVAVGGKQPQLLVIPIRDVVNSTDVISVDLQNKKPAASQPEPETIEDEISTDD